MPNNEEHNHHKHSSEHHHHHHHSDKLSQEEKRHALKKLNSFIRSVRHFKKSCRTEEVFDMEVKRYFYDNFHGFERHWLRHHCPLMKRIKLYFMGVKISKLH